MSICFYLIRLQIEDENMRYYCISEASLVYTVSGSNTNKRNGMPSKNNRASHKHR